MQEKNISLCEQRLLLRLEELWQHPHELSIEILRKLILDIPEEFQAESLETLAGYLANLTKLHFLDIVATFHQKAEEEGFGISERDEIIQDIMPESVRAIDKLGREMEIRSLDDLVLLGNITFGLYSLSQVDTAEAAERWMYKFPKMYRDRLEQEQLLTRPTYLTVIVSAIPVSHENAVSWKPMSASSKSRDLPQTIA